MALLRAYLFRSIWVVTEDGRTLDLGSPTVRSLFAYLLLHRDHPSDRRRLAFLFWPRASEAAARRNLRQYLHRLRRALEPVDPLGGLLIAEHSAVQLDPSAQIWVDVEAFRHNTRPEATLPDLQTAAELYSGDLLEDVYEDWCDETRQELRQSYLNLLDRLSQILQDMGRLDEATAFSQKWIGSEPLDEAGHRRLLSLYALAGDRGRAVSHYQSLKEKLEEELNAEPLPETQILFQAIQRGTYHPDQHLPSTSSVRRTLLPQPTALPLVGRQQELAQLHDALQNARQGHGNFILISGDSGIGKTRLVQEYLSLYPGLLTLQGVCHELESVVPYASLRQALVEAGNFLPPSLLKTPPSWLVTLGYFIPSLTTQLPYLPSRAPMQEESPRLLEALMNLTMTINTGTPDQPLHLIMDDLQWCDGPTWDFLLQLSHQAENHPLLIYGLCRLEDLPRERSRLLRALERNELLLHLPLSRLSIEETAELSGYMLPQEESDPIFINRLYKETEGNPFFIIEMVRSMQEAGHPMPSMDRVRGRQDHNLPLGIQRVIEARLDRLSPKSQEFLAISAAIGTAFSFSWLLEIAQVTAEEGISYIEEWLHRGLVHEVGQTYDFNHEKIRQVAYNSLSHARRQYVHRRIAEVFANTVPPADPATLAYHYARSDQPLKALPFLTQAGEAALRVRSYQEAYQLGLRAVSLLGRMPGPQQRSERIDLNLQLAQAYAFTNDLQRAQEILTETEHLAASLGEEERLGKVYHRLAQIYWLRGQPEVAGDYARRTLRIAEDTNNLSLQMSSLRMLGRVGIALSAFDDAISNLLRYVRLENETAPSSDLPIVLGYLGIAYDRVGSWKRALETARRGLEMAEAEGSTQAVAFARMQLGFVYADSQRWQECLDTLKAIPDPLDPTLSLLDRDADNHNLTPLGFMLLGLRGRALAHRGDVRAGIELIQSGLTWAEKNNYRVFHYMPRLFLVESLYLEQNSNAVDEAHLALHQAREAGNRWAVGVLLRILAESLFRKPYPDWSLIEKYLIESMNLLRQVRARPELARTYLALRRLYDRAGQIAWAVDCHFRATSIFEELGMTDELRLAQGQAAGERRGAVVVSDMRLIGPNAGQESIN